MNFIDKLLLRFFLLPASIYKKAGVDLLQLKAILSAKLTMDNRRPSAFTQQNRRREKQEINQSTLKTVFGALLMGCFMLTSFAIGDDMTTKLTFFMGMFIFMLCMTLITDFTSVLIDVRDNFIILPKPISDVTFVASRLLHITIRVCIVMIPLSLPSCIAICINEGLAALLPFMLMVILCTLFCIFLINAIYILILKFTTPARFQSIISYIQIFFAVFLFAGYQMVPRLMDHVMLTNAHLADMPYIWLLPPFWFAEACLVLARLSFHAGGLVSLALSILVPMVSVWLVVRFFAPSFNRKLSMITGGTQEQSAPVVETGIRSRVSWVSRLATFVTKPGAEFMGFMFGWKMITRSRDFKMKVYPSFGSVLVLGFLFVFSPQKGFTTLGQGNVISPALLMVVYLSSLVPIAAMTQLPYSDKYKASWIFRTAPVDYPGKLICGVVKSVLAFFFVPVVLMILSFGLVIKGPLVVPNMLLGSFNVLAISSLFALKTVRIIPFSAVQEGSSNGGAFINTMLSFFLSALFGFIHWFISGYPYMVVLFLFLSLSISWMVFNEIKKISWESVSSSSGT